MTLTEIRPMDPVQPAQSHRHRRSPWPWVFVAAVLSPFLVVGGVLLTHALPSGPTANGPNGFFNITLSAKWHPNPQNASLYCATVRVLPPSGAQANEQFAALVADEAPNLADRQAAIAYYDDVKNLRPSSGDLAKVQATCPS